jgi:hypothetical protein
MVLFQYMHFAEAVEFASLKITVLVGEILPGVQHAG